MATDPVLACVATLEQAGWQLAPTASPWHVITELHAHRWWSTHLVDTATLSLSTGQGCGHRVQLTAPPDGDGPPQHHLLGTTGLVPLDQLPTLLADWPTPTPEGPPEQ